MRDGCRTGFATPSETFAGGDPENIPDGVANPVRQKTCCYKYTAPAGLGRPPLNPLSSELLLH
ncbi:Uncharacterized protein dnm_026900 [Desulfonema magnum]|uniref:Uncharacterized protein n=1 Tax=Desulfonema magnum TaxID=45655 RepID=A0A975GM92_9BACT|nr:Uncharacterized protein dnm_026900 [Desulfonema magnum]